MDATAYRMCFDEDQLATLCAQYDRRLDSLGAENAKLREERREYQATIDSLVDECADYKAENAKLRELVRDVHALGWSGFDCTECPVSFISRCNDEYSGCEWVTILADRMRNLGIEVAE